MRIDNAGPDRFWIGIFRCARRRRLHFPSDDMTTRGGGKSASGGDTFPHPCHSSFGRSFNAWSARPRTTTGHGMKAVRSYTCMRSGRIGGGSIHQDGTTTAGEGSASTTVSLLPRKEVDKHSDASRDRAVQPERAATGRTLLSRGLLRRRHDGRGWCRGASDSWGRWGLRASSRSWRGWRAGGSWGCARRRDRS